MTNKFKTKCLLIRKQPYKEHSALLHVFSDKYGFISVLAKGIYQDNKKTDLLNILNEYEMILTLPSNAGLHILCELSLISEYRTDLPMPTWFCAQAGLEILSKIIIPVEEIPTYYNSLSSYLQYINGVEKNQIAIFWRFMLHICKLLGVQINLNQCSLCTLKMSAPAGYTADHGCLICNKCLVELPVSFNLSHEAGYILTILPVIGNFLNDLTITSEEIKQINHFFLNYLNQQFHKNITLKSMEYFMI